MDDVAASDDVADGRHEGLGVFQLVGERQEDGLDVVELRVVLRRRFKQRHAVGIGEALSDAERDAAPTGLRRRRQRVALIAHQEARHAGRSQSV